MRAQDSRHASLHSITPQLLASFCKREGYHCQVEMPGSNVSPPEDTVDVTDWDRETAQAQTAVRRCAPLCPACL